ncbi:MAG TPA: MBL fold metallo-hydrolase [Vitreimonas sp.]|uniref:MBL fold metallo-hydrolase n=1 Tax=Vitreimonas sp. TaxID=3069702 RepID=UPI002D528B36|nr:MBL fold metallo-hydrolase [Vitreimonas sp.]HYD86445.1 MBL fold metallo-hydrolase [Vitreimonas sp.]
MKRGVMIALVLAALAAFGAGAFAYRGEIATRLLERAAAGGMSDALAERLPDGLHAIFCGTGSPLPDRSRAGPCFAVLAGDKLFVFDAGEGAAETLALMGVNAGDIEAVFLTHLHSDHFDGLAPLALQHWATGSAQQPLQLIGPTGAARVAAGLNEAYAIDAGYRTAHHGPEIMPPAGAGLSAREFAPPLAAEPIVLHDRDGVRISAFRVDHAPTVAVGYRIEYGGRSIVVSGDTARSDSLTQNARGADLLVHEALSPRLNEIMRSAAVESGRANVGAIFHDILDYHASPEDAGAVAQEAGVGALALTHLLPQTPIPGLVSTFERDARTRFDGPVWAMRDGDVISLPLTGGFERSRRLRF